MTAPYAPTTRVELLAPAGNFEKLELVLHYGADAVYLAGKAFSLRNFAGNFCLEELEAAIVLAHDHNVKVYVAVNIFARNVDLAPLETFLQVLGKLKPDAIIVADPAVLALTHRLLPDMALHLSTQANTTNALAAQFWRSQGVRRVNLARELTLAEIKEIAHQSHIQVEAFVHGAMCISYSGRCLLSNAMAQRPSNQGMCCQPCRFQYAVVEETRPGQFFPLAEDQRGTYIFNSYDLCMLEHLPEMIQAGVRALKIEGRMKGIHYAATSVKIYREAIDCYYQDAEGYQVRPYWRAELDKITSRGYCTGFYLGNPRQVSTCNAPARPSASTLLGKVLASAGRHKAHIEVRNRIQSGECIEILKPSGPAVSDRIIHILDLEGRPVQTAHAGSRVTLHLATDCQRFDLLRRKISPGHEC